MHSLTLSKIMKYLITISGWSWQPSAWTDCNCRFAGVYMRQVRYCSDEFSRSDFNSCLANRKSGGLGARGQSRNLFISVNMRERKKSLWNLNICPEKRKIWGYQSTTNAPNSTLANSHIEISPQVTGKSPFLKAEAHGVRHLEGKK